MRTMIDAGGGTLRIGFGKTEQSGGACAIERLNVSQLRLGSTDELVGLVAQSLSSGIPADQAKVIFSIAGPVNKDGRILLALTNHSGVEETNIPVAEMVEASLKESTGRDIELEMINDGAAGAWAEFGPGGALENVPIGYPGMAIIIGNGVGGRMYSMEEGGISQLPGADEPGHWVVNSQIVRPMGLDKLVATELECGCGRKGNIRDIACFETLTKGPAIESMFRKFLRKVSIGMRTLQEEETALQHMDRNFPNVMITTEEASGHELLNRGDIVTNKDVSAFLAKNPEGDLLTEVFFSRIAKLFVARMADLQHNFNSLGPITFTFIGGIGCALGEYLIPLMERGFDEMKDKGHVVQWDHRPNLRASNHPADHTNLIGAYYYLIGRERERALRA